MDRALAEENNEDEVLARLRSAAQNTWEHRIGSIEVIEAVLGRKRTMN